MSNLTPNDATLLAAMMGTIGTIWSVGLAVYVFIYGYFASNVRSDLEDLEFRMKNSGSDKATQSWLLRRRTRADKRLRRYEVVFTGYLLTGLLTPASILVSGATIAYDRPDWIQIAGAFFVVALGSLVTLLSFEVFTSLRQVREHRGEVRPRQR